MATLLEKLLTEIPNLEWDNHATDLHLERNEKALEIINKHYKDNGFDPKIFVNFFTNQISKTPWVEVTFALFDEGLHVKKYGEFGEGIKNYYVRNNLKNGKFN